MGTAFQGSQPVNTPQASGSAAAALAQGQQNPQSVSYPSSPNFTDARFRPLANGQYGGGANMGNGPYGGRRQ
jgi:hypothetical protein